MRVLFVCAANVDRSPTAETVLRALGGGHESRSAGVLATARRPVAASDLEWADLVAVMEEPHRALLAERWPAHAGKLRVLDIPDRYRRDDPALVAALEPRLERLVAEAGGIIAR